MSPEFEVMVNAEVSFECVCGKNLWKSMSDVIEDDIECFANQKVNCRDCGRSYIFDINEDEELIVKLTL